MYEDIGTYTVVRLTNLIPKYNIVQENCNENEPESSILSKMKIFIDWSRECFIFKISPLKTFPQQSTKSPKVRINIYLDKDETKKLKADVNSIFAKVANSTKFNRLFNNSPDPSKLYDQRGKMLDIKENLGNFRCELLAAYISQLQKRFVLDSNSNRSFKALIYLDIENYSNNYRLQFGIPTTEWKEVDKKIKDDKIYIVCSLLEFANFRDMINGAI